jgi:predicted metal-binding membrane protein
MDIGAPMPMNGMVGMQMPMPGASWTLSCGVLMLAMWWIMMAAMMLPSSAPMILLFATANGSERPRRPNFHLRVRLPFGLGCFQPDRDGRPMGACLGWIG